MLYKVILRAFPSHFKDNSIYAHFPFVIPEENLVIMKSLGRADKYSWDKPTRVPELIIVKSHTAAKKILDDKANWKVTWGDAIKFLASQPKKVHGVDFCLSGDKSANEVSRKLIMRGLYPQQWQQEVKSFYEQTTVKLLKKYSYELPGTKTRQVDIVRDVGDIWFFVFLYPISTIFGLYRLLLLLIIA